MVDLDAMGAEDAAVREQQDADFVEATAVDEAARAEADAADRPGDPGGWCVVWCPVRVLPAGLEQHPHHGP
eukprot:5894404-Prymnesium_polylepis.1